MSLGFGFFMFLFGFRDIEESFSRYDLCLSGTQAILILTDLTALRLEQLTVDGNPSYGNDQVNRTKEWKKRTSYIPYKGTRDNDSLVIIHCFEYLTRYHIY